MMQLETNMPSDSTPKPISMRLPPDLIERADRVMDYVYSRPALRYARSGSRSAVLMYLIERGLQAVEAELADDTDD